MPASEPDQKPARLGGGGGAVKLAPTLVACVTEIVHVALVPLPPHAPLQPANVLPPVAAAVSVTCVFWTNSSVQSPDCEADEMVQAIPVALMVPVPVPDAPAATVTKNFGGGGGAKLALTLVF